MIVDVFQGLAVEAGLGRRMRAGASVNFRVSFRS